VSVHSAYSGERIWGGATNAWHAKQMSSLANKSVLHATADQY